MTTTKPAPTLEPAFTYLELSRILGVSKSYVEKQVRLGHLRSFREGRFCKVLESELHAWRSGQLERSETKRTGRAGRRELTPVPTRSVAPMKRDYSHLDADIRERLGLT